MESQTPMPQPGGQPPRAPQSPAQGEGETSRLAVWSLICGVASFFTCGLTALPGIILGALGLSNISKSGGQLKGNALAVAGIVTSVFAFLVVPIVAIMAAMLMPALAQARGEARKAACKGNLHNIGLGFAMYMNDYRTTPPDLDGLYPVYVEALETFDCPGAGTFASYPGLEQSTSYRYVGPINEAAPGDTIVVYDQRGNHPDGRIALFMDCHVEFIPEAALADRLRGSLEGLKAAGWDQYSEEQKERIGAFYTPD